MSPTGQNVSAASSVTFPLEPRKAPYVKSLSLFALATMLAMTTSALAQERTAGGPIETQMTWSALTARIGAADTKIIGVNGRIDQLTVCGGKGMVYAPGQNGADTQGCKQPATASSITTDITNLRNSLNATNGSLGTVSNGLNATNSKVSSIISCNQQGLIFNGAGCVAPASMSSRCKVTLVAPSSVKTGPGSVASACPDGALIAAQVSKHDPSGGRGGSTYDVDVSYCVKLVCD